MDEHELYGYNIFKVFFHDAIHGKNKNANGNAPTFTRTENFKLFARFKRRYLKKSMP